MIFPPKIFFANEQGQGNQCRTPVVKFETLVGAFGLTLFCAFFVGSIFAFSCWQLLALSGWYFLFWIFFGGRFLVGNFCLFLVSFLVLSGWHFWRYLVGTFWRFLVEIFWYFLAKYQKVTQSTRNLRKYHKVPKCTIKYQKVQESTRK